MACNIFSQYEIFFLVLRKNDAMQQSSISPCETKFVIMRAQRGRTGHSAGAQEGSAACAWDR
jgi:hypothetical protein